MDGQNRREGRKEGSGLTTDQGRKWVIIVGAMKFDVTLDEKGLGWKGDDSQAEYSVVPGERAPTCLLFLLCFPPAPPAAVAPACEKVQTERLH